MCWFMSLFGPRAAFLEKAAGGVAFGGGAAGPPRGQQPPPARPDAAAAVRCAAAGGGAGALGSLAARVGHIKPGQVGFLEAGSVRVSLRMEFFF